MAFWFLFTVQFILLLSVLLIGCASNYLFIQRFGRQVEQLGGLCWMVVLHFTPVDTYKFQMVFISYPIYDPVHM